MLLQEEPVVQSEHSRDISLALSSPTVSNDTHPTTTATEVCLTSTTAPLIKFYCSHFNPTSPSHIQAMLQSLTLFHIMSTSQSLALHISDNHAGTSTAAFGTFVALKQFQTFVYSRSLDVIALTVTWLNDNIHDNEILRQAYYYIIQIDPPWWWIHDFYLI